MPEAKDDPAGIYRTYLSEIRNLNELTAAELTERLLQWRTVKDSVFACLRRDTLDPLRPYIEKACKVMHDSLRIEFSRLALSGPRTYGELLKLKERLSPYIEDRSYSARPERLGLFSPRWMAVRLFRATGSRFYRHTAPCLRKPSEAAYTAATI